MRAQETVQSLNQLQSRGDLLGGTALHLRLLSGQAREVWVVGPSPSLMRLEQEQGQESGAKRCGQGHCHWVWLASDGGS